MSKTKEFYHDKIEEGLREHPITPKNNVYIDVNIIDYLNDKQIDKITEFAFEEAKEKIKHLLPDFNDNLFTFAYTFECKVNIYPNK